VAEEVEDGEVLVPDIQVVQEAVDQDQDKEEDQQLNLDNQAIQELLDLEMLVLIHQVQEVLEAEAQDQRVMMEVVQEVQEVQEDHMIFQDHQ
jgi:BioD-like phosphotransacetylase family protein